MNRLQDIQDIEFKKKICTASTLGQAVGDAMTTVIRLGGDTDTNAAVAGAAAGPLYGIGEIPERWLAKLQKKEEIEKTAAGFAAVL